MFIGALQHKKYFTETNVKEVKHRLIKKKKKCQTKMMQKAALLFVRLKVKASTELLDDQVFIL